jgi:hypothetical protein
MSRCNRFNTTAGSIPKYLQSVDTENGCRVAVIESKRRREKVQDLLGGEVGRRNHYENNTRHATG